MKPIKCSFCNGTGIDMHVCGVHNPHTFFTLCFKCRGCGVTWKDKADEKDVELINETGMTRINRKLPDGRVIDHPGFIDPASMNEAIKKLISLGHLPEDDIYPEDSHLDYYYYRRKLEVFP